MATMVKFWRVLITNLFLLNVVLSDAAPLEDGIRPIPGFRHLYNPITYSGKYMIMIDSRDCMSLRTSTVLILGE